jgi:acyl-CoA synthetase (AMP-forming)/AMP-acid ligase II
VGVASLFQRGASHFPDRTCLVDGIGSKTYREVDASSNAIAAQLQLSGLGAAHCAVYSGNSALAFECILGIFRAGAVFVPVNSKNHVSDNVGLIGSFDVEVLFYDARFSREVEIVRENCPGITTFICMNGEGPASERHDPDRIVSIYSTGGTTGLPKGVTFTSRTWDAMAANYFPHLPRKGPSSYLIVSPITHAAGTIGLLMLAEGATLIIHDGFNAARIFDEIERSKVTHLYLPPTAIYMLLSEPDLRERDFSSLQGFIYTSAPMSVDRLKECLDVFGPVMLQFWGQTEAPIFCTCLPPELHDREGPGAGRLASCGQRTLLTEVGVMDPEGRLLPAGERGELVVRGDLVMSGYYRNPEATAEASRYGWHHTGDVGFMDEDGFVYIVDRLKDMIITGGFNVYPAEVEAILMQHPAIQDCAVIGLPDEKWGEAVTAFVEVRTGRQAETEELIAFCKDKLGSVKTPKSVEIVGELPRTPVGKIAKKEIRAQYWQNTGRSI